MFTRKKITVPSAGESNNFFLEGNSIVIESVPFYSSPEQVPLLAFGDRSNTPQPIYPQSTYRSDAGFNRFAIIGTDESAGDTIYVLASDQCLQEEINFNLGTSRRSIQGASFSVDSTDTAQQLPTVSLVDADGNYPSEIAITCAVNPVKYAFDSAPVQGSGIGSHINPSNEQILKIQGESAIRKFKFISAVSASAGTLTIHVTY